MVEFNNISNDSVSLAQKLEIYLQAHLDNNHFMGSVLVSYQGKVLLSEGYGMANLEHNVPNLPSTKFRIASISKQFTAAAILQLQEQKLLDINDSLATYLPKYPRGEQIIVRQLLNHTSGISNYTSFEDYESKKSVEIELDKLIDWFKDRPLDFTPGERFSYSNSGYIVLTKIIETVSGLSYKDYLEQHIFALLGMNDSGCDSTRTVLFNRAAGYLFTGESYVHADSLDISIMSGAGALYSTVEDLYKWSRTFDTNIILNQASRDAMFAPTVEVLTGEESNNFYYGYGLRIDTEHNRNRIAHDGGIDGFLTHFARYPDERVTVIVLSNLQTASIPKITQDLAAIIFDEPYEFPKKREAINLAPAILERYAGQYKFKPSPYLSSEDSELFFTVTTDLQRIFIQVTGREKDEIFPESPTEFFLKAVDAQLTFITNDEGESQLIIYQHGRDKVLNKID
ncbi:beta-lactamase [Synechococcus sp. PCC 7335]|uniref:serine hydrolase n=1 Tax=Synechococcus sp. (strain ATCC 29403 / PCC 7335) TaxID=91464 RepID=UPI00017EC0D6|nr:serine hydrolase [Synechococcus sp. PCC 7335]EDX82392.1 beta-lactamase [Synechococcus sp. PCC 7335]